MALLAQHRAMPSTPNRLSPAELFLNHPIRVAKVRLPIAESPVFNVDVVSDSAQGEILGQATVHSIIVTGHSDFSATLIICMLNLAKVRPLFHQGEKVLVHAGQVPKGASPYRGPYTVVHILGQYTFLLSDRQNWSARHLK